MKRTMRIIVAAAAIFLNPAHQVAAATPPDLNEPADGVPLIKLLISRARMMIPYVGDTKYKLMGACTWLRWTWTGPRLSVTTKQANLAPTAIVVVRGGDQGIGDYPMWWTPHIALLNAAGSAITGVIGGVSTDAQPVHGGGLATESLGRGRLTRQGYSSVDVIGHPMRLGLPLICDGSQGPLYPHFVSELNGLTWRNILPIEQMVYGTLPGHTLGSGMGRWGKYKPRNGFMRQPNEKARLATMVWRGCSAAVEGGPFISLPFEGAALPIPAIPKFPGLEGIEEVLGMGKGLMNAAQNLKGANLTAKLEDLGGKALSTATEKFNALGEKVGGATNKFKDVRLPTNDDFRKLAQVPVLNNMMAAGGGAVRYKYRKGRVVVVPKYEKHLIGNLGKFLPTVGALAKMFKSGSFNLSSLGGLVNLPGLSGVGGLGGLIDMASGVKDLSDFAAGGGLANFSFGIDGLIPTPLFGKYKYFNGKRRIDPEDMGEGVWRELAPNFEDSGVPDKFSPGNPQLYDAIGNFDGGARVYEFWRDYTCCKKGKGKLIFSVLPGDRDL